MYLYNLHGVRIPNVVSAHFNETDAWFKGTASKEVVGTDGKYKGSQELCWFAQATPKGYIVEVVNMINNRREQFKGSTFNLILEVAAAIRRFS